MSSPEFLLIFSDSGSMTARVKFRQRGAKIAERRLASKELANLLQSDGEGFHTRMYFDEHPAKIERFEIDPASAVLTIYADLIKTAEEWPSD